MESELIIDRTGGARSKKFTEMTTEELRVRVWAFPEARTEYVKRVTKEAQDSGTIPSSR